MYTITSRVGASQTGADGNMKLVSAIDVMQDCSILWMESEPSFARFLTKNNLGMFLLFRQADILRLPQYGEEVRATTSIYQCKGYYGYRNTVLYGGDGAPCVLSWGIGAFVKRESGRMARLANEEIARITIEPQLEMDYQSKRIVPPDAAWRRLPEVPVRRGDIDFYGHVNNARYLEAALEVLPVARPVDRLRVEYKTPARLGHVLYPSLIEADDRTYLSLSDKDQNPYSVMEFSWKE